jgi:probable F420-dependent oxidoreductase
LVTGVIVSPQRQTALLAKQAAEVDALSGGRLRLGLGVGQVARETEALGVDFHTRGQRMDEQLTLLRRLWTEEAMTFEGRWHHITDGGGLTGPRPVQRPIPIWIGGRSEAAMQRAARVADGWMPLLPAPDEQARVRVEAFRACAAAGARLPSEVGLEVWGPLAGMTESGWAAHAAGWRELGATHYAVVTSGMGLTSAHAHIDQLRRVREVLADEFAVVM